jgi:hypothetical protein
MTTSAPPLKVPIIEKSTKAKIIQRLISNKVWEGVSYLVTGKYSGDNMELAATFFDLDFSFVSVGNLLSKRVEKYYDLIKG